MSHKIPELPISQEIAESSYTLERIRKIASGTTTQKAGMHSDMVEIMDIFLCLANEIQKLKELQKLDLQQR